MFKKSSFIAISVLVVAAAALHADNIVDEIIARIDDQIITRAELERAVALQPDSPEAYYLLQHTYLRLGEKEKAENALATFKKYHAAEYSERQDLLKQMQKIVGGER